MPVKYVFVTGGVVSGLGKGITAASLGRLLKARGYKVTMQKFDPYINIDPGTMNPIQHGEVFVTDDGAETDLDLGHYERFIDESLTKNSNVTTGKVYWSVLQKERRGDFGGGTVQGFFRYISGYFKLIRFACRKFNPDIDICTVIECLAKEIHCQCLNSVFISHYSMCRIIFIRKRRCFGCITTPKAFSTYIVQFTPF